MTAGVLFDVDGTLADTNYLHAVAWADAFRLYDHNVATSRLHALIGQGSDRLVRSILGRSEPRIVDAHADLYAARLQRLAAFDGSANLLHQCKLRGLTIVLATSASRHEAEHLRQAVDPGGCVDHLVTADDVAASKPSPDIVEAALAAADIAAQQCVFVGDSIWDVQAAARAGVSCVCVLTGGNHELDLRGAGAIAIYADVATLGREFDASPLGGLVRRNAG